MNQAEGQEWLDRAVGECVAATQAVKADAAGVAGVFPRLAGIVEKLAAEVMAGSDAAGLAVESSRRSAAMAAGVLEEWGKLRPLFFRYRVLLSGGGFSVCSLALAFLLWPQAAAADHPDRTPDPQYCGLPDPESLIADGRLGEAERAVVGLPDVRRYHMLGEISRARGDEAAAVWFYEKAYRLGNRQAGLCLTARTHTPPR